MVKTTGENQSGQQLAASNLQRFLTWIEERDVVNDWSVYIRQGKLNRSEIASECGFALSVVRQNPAVKTAMEALEERLRVSGTRPAHRPLRPLRFMEAAVRSD